MDLNVAQIAQKSFIPMLFRHPTKKTYEKKLVTGMVNVMLGVHSNVTGYGSSKGKKKTQRMGVVGVLRLGAVEKFL